MQRSQKNKNAMTVQNIAELAGVSNATVSRVINKNPQVAPQLAEAVRQAIKKMGYSDFTVKTVGRPRKLVSGFETGLVAMLFPDPSKGALLTTLSSRLCQGIENTLRAHGLNLLITGLTGDNGLPECIKRHKVDGVIIRSRPFGIPTVPVPSVVTFEQAPDTALTLDTAAEDNSGIGVAAASILLARGHRRLALISPEAGHPSFLIRSLFFRHHAETAGATADIFQAAEGANPVTLIEQVLASPAKPTGFFIAGHDPQTLMLLRLLRERVQSKGKYLDLICCHNDAAQVSVVDPNAVILDIQPEEIGRAAAELLIWRKNNLTAPFRKVIIPHRVIQPAQT